MNANAHRGERREGDETKGGEEEEEEREEREQKNMTMMLLAHLDLMQPSACADDSEGGEEGKRKRGQEQRKVVCLSACRSIADTRIPCLICAIFLFSSLCIGA